MSPVICIILCFSTFILGYFSRGLFIVSKDGDSITMEEEKSARERLRKWLADGY